MNLNIEKVEIVEIERVAFLNYSVNLWDSIPLHGDLGRILSEVIIWILLL